jgi:hypothetical protein
VRGFVPCRRVYTLVVVDGYEPTWFIVGSSLAGRVRVGWGSVYFTPSSGFPSPAHADSLAEAIPRTVYATRTGALWPPTPPRLPKTVVSPIGMSATVSGDSRGLHP